MPDQVAVVIRRYIDERGLSQGDIGQCFDPPVTQGAISQMLLGEIAVTPKRAIDWEKALPGVVTRQQIRPDIFGKVAA